MKKSTVLNIVSAVYAVIGALCMCMIDHHMGISVLCVICFAGAYGYSDAADQSALLDRQHHDRLMAELYEDATYRDEN